MDGHEFRTSGDVMKALREKAGLTQGQLASAVYTTQTYLGHWEAGRRTPLPKMAQAIDRVLGAGGLLIDLWEADRLGSEGDVRRRLLLNGLAAVGGVGIAAPGLLAASVRASFAAQLGGTVGADEWVQLAADYGRRYNATAPAVVARELAGELLVLRDHLGSEATTQHAVAARLLTVYASAVASAGDPAGSRRWYRLAKAAADVHGDTTLTAYVRGREAFRYAFDGAAPAAEILTLAKDVPAVEAHLARAHAHSMLGNRTEADKALGDARRAFDVLDEQDPTSMYDMQDWRFAQSESLIHARTGRAGAALRVLDAAPTTDLTRFRVHTEVYRGLAEAKAGDVASGRQRARAAIGSIPTGQRSIVLTRIADEIGVSS